MAELLKLRRTSLLLPLGIVLLMLPIFTLGMTYAQGAEPEVLLFDGAGAPLLERESLFGRRALSPGEFVDETITAVNHGDHAVTLWIRPVPRQENPLWWNDTGAQVRVRAADGVALFEGAARIAAVDDVPVVLPAGTSVRFTLGVGLPRTTEHNLTGLAIDIDFQFLTSDS